MNMGDQLQQNIRRTTGLHALKHINVIVEEDHQIEEAKAKSLRWLRRYGWVSLLAVCALLGYLTGVY